MLKLVHNADVSPLTKKSTGSSLMTLKERINQAQGVETPVETPEAEEEMLDGTLQAESTSA